MGCGCGKPKTGVVPSLVAADGTVTQYEDKGTAEQERAKHGGELRWLPKKESGS